MRMLIKQVLVAIMAIFSTPIFADSIEVQVHGMTCAFCVDSLERKLSVLPSVTNVQVSLKAGKVRLDTGDNPPKIDAIEKAILDAGFTPVKVTVLSDDNEKE